MPGPWQSATADPGAWAAYSLSEGGYIEFGAYDTSNVKQGTVLCRIDKLEDRTKSGQVSEVTVLAVSDDHLLWWMEHGGGKDEEWQCELHLCKGVARTCKQGRRGRGLDFHSDRFRHVPLGDLGDHKVDWLKKSKCKKNIDEEVERMAASFPTGKGSGSREGGAGLDFEEVGKKKRQQADPQGGFAGPLKRESVEGRKKKKKKRRKEGPGHGRARSAPASGAGKGVWLGEPVGEDPKDRSLTDTSGRSSSTESSSDRKKGKENKKKSKRKLSKDRGPLGSGTQIDYSRALEVSSDPSDEGTLQEMKTLAAALVMIAAGRSRTLSLRLKVLELLQSDTTRNRAQFLELLEPVGPALLETGEAVLASKEWAGDLGMRKLQAGKGQGSHNKRDFQKTGEKTDTKGGKDGGKKEKHGKGKKG
ncbi:nhaA, partial [Symbiodinium microadriaticum]